MKEKLHRLIDTARTKEDEVLVPDVSDAPPPVPDQWTAKDQLAHLTAWRVVGADELDASRTGRKPMEVSTDDDVANAKFYAETHDKPASEIIAAARESWDRLAAAVDAASDEDLAKPRLRQPEQPAWITVPNNTYDHLPVHLAYWYSDQGDEVAAEQAAIWGHDLAMATFTDDRARGSAAYNLGCYYAMRGRTADAMPHLARAFQLRPELRHWAKEDSDLNPIRSAEELNRLLR